MTTKRERAPVLGKRVYQQVQPTFSWFYDLQEQVSAVCGQLSGQLSGDTLQVFEGARVSFMKAFDRFKGSLLDIELQLTVAKPLAEIGQERAAKLLRNAQLETAYDEGEEARVDKKLKVEKRVETKSRELLDRSKTVGAPYTPEFLAEECVRAGTDFARNLSGQYETVQEAFKELVARDPDLSKEQIDRTKEILAEMGFTV